MPTQYLFLHFPSSKPGPPASVAPIQPPRRLSPSAACRGPLRSAPSSSRARSVLFSRRLSSSLRWRRGPLVASSRPRSGFYSNGIWDHPRKKPAPPALPRLPPPLPRARFDSGFLVPAARLKIEASPSSSLSPALGRVEPSFLTARDRNPPGPRWTADRTRVPAPAPLGTPAIS